MKSIALTVSLLVMLTAVSCAKPKAKPLTPLTLASGAPPQAVSLTQRGTEAFSAKQFVDAKTFFDQAVKAAPDSGQAHYNYALSLNAVGETEEARQHFIDAANLAPGDKVIWDSPALRPFGNPDVPKGPPKEHPYGTRRPTFGGGPR